MFLRISWGLMLICFGYYSISIKILFCHFNWGWSGIFQHMQWDSKLWVSMEISVHSITDTNFYSVLNRENLECTYPYFNGNSKFFFWYIKVWNSKWNPCKCKDSNYSCNVLSITETWCNDPALKSNLNLYFDIVFSRKKNK